MLQTGVVARRIIVREEPRGWAFAARTSKDFEFRISNCGLRFSNFDFPVSNFEFRVFLKAVIHVHAPECS